MAARSVFGGIASTPSTTSSFGTITTTTAGSTSIGSQSLADSSSDDGSSSIIATSVSSGMIGKPTEGSEMRAPFTTGSFTSAVSSSSALPECLTTWDASSGSLASASIAAGKPLPTFHDIIHHLWTNVPNLTLLPTRLQTLKHDEARQAVMEQLTKTPALFLGMSTFHAANHMHRIC
jgi:hypothetical protein